MQVIEVVWMVVPVDVLTHHPALGDSRPDDGTGSDQRKIIVALEFHQKLPHRGTLNVKTSDGIGLSDLLSDQRILFEGLHVADVDINSTILFDQINGFADMTETALAENVQLVQ